MALKFKLPKFKLSKSFFSPEASRFWYLVIILIMVGILGAIGFFLYRNLYQTIAQSEEIILLRKEVAPSTIDSNKVNGVLTAINNKTTQKNIEWDKDKNPFVTAVVVQPVVVPAPPAP